jgi:hypothetical protein
MTVVAPDTAALAPSPGQRASSAAIVATRATTFLRAQAQWLRRGLEHADDAVALGIVLAAHDRSHERWVAHVRAIDDALGATAAQAVSVVYSHLGRVAGSLESGTWRQLAADVGEQARQVVAERLTELTEQTVDALWREAALV